MILLIDNYDSFVYNLYQFIAETGQQVKTVRNDRITPEEVLEMRPDAVVISPGPGKPADAGICEELIRKAAGKISLLGVCLGHQAIADPGGQISFSGGPGGHHSGGDPGDGMVRGRRGYGDRTQTVSGIRNSVSSGIGDDAGGTQDDRKFCPLSHDRAEPMRERDAGIRIIIMKSIQKTGGRIL